MITAVIDFETYLTGPGVAVPRLVLGGVDRGHGARVLPRDEILDELEDCLRDPGVQVVNHNVSFDLAVAVAERPRLLPLVASEINAGRVRCTQIREKLVANMKGELKYEWDDELNQYKKSRFRLVDLTYRRLGERRTKGADSYQKRWSEFDGWKIQDIPPDAIDYILRDVDAPRRIFDSQERETAPEGIPGELAETRAAWWLQVAGAYGSRTDPDAVEVYCAALDEEHRNAVERAMELGMVRLVGGKPTRDTRAIHARVTEWHLARGLRPPRTSPSKRFPSGQVQADRECLTAAKYRERGPEFLPDPALLAVADVVRLEKLRSTYAPILRWGTKYPVTPHYNTPIETIRTSCASPNLQNLPREGGIRPCFVPRPGWWYVFCDYDTLEMRTLAQACLDIPEVGYSDLAEALRAGLDPHVELAAELLGVPGAAAQRGYLDGDDRVANARQFAKIGNYGLGGGMGPPAFVDYARGCNIDITIARAVEIHEAYRRRWSEMTHYFRYCSRLCDGGTANVVFPRSNVLRGNVRYTAVCNGFFQHPAAMGAKAALCSASEECYLDSSSPLYGCRPWYFGHDEIGMEVPADVARASAAADRLNQVMVREMSKWCPDVPIKASAIVSRRWYKGAKPLRVNGHLVPVKKEGKRWVQDLAN